MTLIIAHRDGWMAADRRTVFEHNLIGPYRVSKIKRAPRLLVASAGNSVFADLIQQAIDNARRDIQHLVPNADYFREVVQVFRDKGADIGGHALALTPDGLCEITSRGGALWLDADYWAIGSGYPFALGYLAGISRGDSSKITPDHALDAINFAATRTNDVGDGHQLEYLGVPKEEVE